MLASIPVWVPAIFLLLLALGYRQSLARTVHPAKPVSFALIMFGFSLYGVLTAFGSTAMALAPWSLGYVLVLLGGIRLLRPGGLTLVGTSVRIPGSWLPLSLILGTFTIKFILGMATGWHSPVLHNAWFIMLMSFTMGALSGSFGARALAIYRFVSMAEHNT